MFLIVMLFLIMLMFSGGSYYGHRRGFYGARMAYGEIGLGWIIILFGLLFLMPNWGFMGR
jgi:hypothetical protein